MRCIYALAAFALAFVIMRRNRSSAGHLMASAAILLLAPFIPADAFSAYAPWMKIPAIAVGLASMAGFFGGIFLFPNGRFTPRWTRFALPLSVGFMWIMVLALKFIPAWGAYVLVAGIMVSAVMMLTALIVRFRKHSSGVERLQTRWVVMALTVYLVAGQAAVLFQPVKKRVQAWVDVRLPRESAALETGLDALAGDIETVPNTSEIGAMISARTAELLSTTRVDVGWSAERSTQPASDPSNPAAPTHVVPIRRHPGSRTLGWMSFYARADGREYDKPVRDALDHFAARVAQPVAAGIRERAAQEQMDRSLARLEALLMGSDGPASHLSPDNS